MVSMASLFSIKILSQGSPHGFDKEKKMIKKMHVCNMEIRIEETLSLWKAKAGIKENDKMSEY